jgi:hypothetical protein
MSHAEKALGQVIRYARLQTVITQRKRLYGRLFDHHCENPCYLGDQEDGSGCMAALKQAKSNNDKLSCIDPERLSFWELVDECEFCRPCKVGLLVLRHNRERLAKRRGSLLAAMRRLGSKA